MPYQQQLFISFEGHASKELQDLHDRIQAGYLKQAKFIHRRFSQHDVLIAVDKLRAQSTGYFDERKATSWDVFWNGEKKLCTYFQNATADEAKSQMASDLAVIDIKQHHREVLMRSIAENMDEIQFPVQSVCIPYDK